MAKLTKNKQTSGRAGKVHKALNGFNNNFPLHIHIGMEGTCHDIGLTIGDVKSLVRKPITRMRSVK